MVWLMCFFPLDPVWKPSFRSEATIPSAFEDLTRFAFPLVAKWWPTAEHSTSHGPILVFTSGTSQRRLMDAQLLRKVSQWTNGFLILQIISPQVSRWMPSGSGMPGADQRLGSLRVLFLVDLHGGKGLAFPRKALAKPNQEPLRSGCAKSSCQELFI